MGEMTNIGLYVISDRKPEEDTNLKELGVTVIR
jgi:hypothetical protein